MHDEEYDIYDGYEDKTYPCQCPECGERHLRLDMNWTYDFHGIPFRLLCPKCYEHAMAKGYDGEYYDECDECLAYDY